MQTQDIKKPIQHIAIIMDGNGRWATQQHLSRLQGHTEGAKRVYEITEAMQTYGIKNLSLFAFSTENWKRSPAEIEGLFALLNQFAKQYAKTLVEKNIKLIISGDMTPLPEGTRSLLKKVIDSTSTCKAYILNICINYGGQDDIVRAAKMIATEVKEGRLAVEAIDTGLFSKYLYTEEMPPVDLLIRTSGEQRLSNFLLYQLAYAELYFTDVYWPAFNKEQLNNAIEAYYGRDRRFGSVE
jgi:undecaprenyl diphosphate synthase